MFRLGSWPPEDWFRVLRDLNYQNQSVCLALTWLNEKRHLFYKLGLMDFCTAGTA